MNQVTVDDLPGLFFVRVEKVKTGVEPVDTSREKTNGETGKCVTRFIGPACPAQQVEQVSEFVFRQGAVDIISSGAAEKNRWGIGVFFISRVDKLIIDIDALGQELVQAIAADSVPRRRRQAA